MAYLGKPFEHDIFVSYSHGDAEGTGDSKLKRWSQAFVRELKNELQVDGPFAGKVSIFLDESPRVGQGIDPGSPLTGQLQAASGGAAILTILMSPQYLSSQYCTDERVYWLEKQSSLGLQTDNRIAVVRVLPTRGVWPPPLSDGRGQPAATGFWFYDRTQEGPAVRPYEWPVPQPDSGGEFRKEILRLAGWIGLRLQDAQARLEEKRVMEAHVARLGATMGQKVYLHGRAEEAATWERAFDDLSQIGLVVTPSEPSTDAMSTSIEKLEANRRHRVDAIRECDALLLLGAGDSHAAEVDLVAVGSRDRNSARAISKRPLPCAMIDRAGPALATHRRKGLAQKLSVEWIDATAEPWTPFVQKWLVDAAQAEATS